MALSPPDEREQYVAQFPALWGERVGVTHRTLVVGGARDDSGLLDALQALGRQEPPIAPGANNLIAGALAAWFALVVLLGANGAFVRPPGTAPLPIFIGFAVPIAVFLVVYWFSSAFRALVLGLDLRLATAIQAWRLAGLGFIALYTYGVLPGLFALPAGLGDIAIGLTAPWVMRALERRPAFVASKGFVVWNLLGILDLLIAVGTGTTSSLLAVGAAGEITMAPMAELPLVLIPAFLVPIFIMLHVAALIQARRFAGSGDRRESATR